MDDVVIIAAWCTEDKFEARCELPMVSLIVAAVITAAIGEGFALG